MKRDSENIPEVVYEAFEPDLNSTSDAGKWYYHDGTNIVECDGNHDGYEMIIH